MKFCADRHFTYITTHTDKSKEEIQSYYNLIEDDLEEITKYWSAEFLIPTDLAELSNLEQIRSLENTREAHDTPRTSRRKKTEEVQQLRSTIEETTSESLG
jgi:ribosomal protein L9